MSRKAISVSIICMMLTASFVITGMTIGKSKPKQAAGSPQKKTSKPDPPSTIDGNVSPELIPDHIAYMMVFRTIALRQNTDFEKNRSRAWARSVGLDDASADKLLAAANKFHMRVSVLDNQVKEIKDRTWPDPSVQVMEQLNDLQKKKEAIVADIVFSLPTLLGTEVAEKLHQHINSHIKRKVKIAPGLATPPKKHH